MDQSLYPMVSHVIPQPQLPPQLAEALVHASPETVRAIKGTLWRQQALESVRDSLTVAVTNLSGAIRDQATLRPLGDREQIEAAIRQEVVQQNGCRGGPSVSVHVHMALRRSHF